MFPQSQRVLTGVGTGEFAMGRLKLRLETDEWIYEEYDLN
jgi:hypothetical protein